MPELCPTCGNALPASAPRGFCPTCLLRGGLTLPEAETMAFQARIELPPDVADAASNEPLLGGRYVLGLKLGEGGFGVVYEAEQTEPLRRTVAVKILKPGMDTRSVIARFDAERQTLALMEHPHIARVLDAGETADGRPFFVMERVRGIPVTAFVKKLDVPLAERLDLFALICDAVHHAHQKGIIHRDIKPSNILIEDDNGRPRPKVIDFGIAKALAGPMTDHTVFTAVDQILGTPGYISPEQIERGAAAVDIRADVYALGALLYEMLCDVPVVDPASFAGKPLSQALRELAERRPPRPSLRKSELRGDLDAITLKALASDPAIRYASADALAEDVRRHLRHEPIRARQPGRLYLMRKFVRRHRVGVAAALAVLAAVLAGGVTSTLLYFKSEKSKHEVMASRDALKRSYSHSDFQNARQVSERGRLTEAITYLCRAIRSDPGNTTAGTYLASILSHLHLAHAVNAALPAPDGCDEISFVAVSAATGQAMGICTAGGKDDAGKDKPAIMRRWIYNTGETFDDELPAGTRAHSLLVTPDGFLAVTGLSDGGLWICNLISGEFSTIATSLPGAITALAATADSRHLLCGTETGSVQLWSLESRKPDADALALRGPIRQLIIGAQPDVASAFSDAAIVVFDPTMPRLLGLPQNYPDLACFAMQAQGQRILAGLASGSAQLRAMVNGTYIGIPLAHAGPVTAATFGPEGQILVTGDRSGLLHVWRADNGNPAGPAQEMDGPVVFCQATPGRGLFVSVSGRGEVRLWNPAAGGLIASNRTRRNVRSAAMSGDGTHVALALKDEPAVLVWEVYARMIEPRYYSADAKPPEFALHLKSPPPEDAGEGAMFCWNAARTHGAVLAADGSTVTVGSQGSKPVRVSPNVLALALSDDGQTLATAHADRNVRLWNVARGTQLSPGLLHNTAVQHIAFTPDGGSVITATEEGELRCWDTATRDPLMPPVNRGDKLKALATTGDGTRILFQRQSGGWFSLPVPARIERMPAWFLAVAESIARRRLNADGTTDNLSQDSLLAALAAIPRSPAPGEKRLASLARWLVANPARRTLWPDDRGEFADYVSELIATREPEALREVLRFDPLNGEAQRLLRGTAAP
ncbi:MAG: protein kinase [Verrucomicrobiaceae bacterium]|nr:protein kinase [Verrucomicrobiaceae bacterium]